ncbi:MAG: hypothetical protein LBU67_05000 [Oscillospiraceae bacterium]|jgi:hypothetical protein|nr:hypothetical protein [Oscillospiraceae bacterium]
MQGYDEERAAQSIAARLNPKQYPDLEPHFDSLVRQAISLDLAYMRESGAVDADGLAGGAYYDDDEAFEYLLDGIVRARGWDDEREMKLASFLDDYMDAQQAYMEEIGLLDWD